MPRPLDHRACVRWCLLRARRLRQAFRLRTEPTVRVRRFYRGQDDPLNRAKVARDTSRAFVRLALYHRRAGRLGL